MILPGKHLRPDRALLTIGSEILVTMTTGTRTVSSVWDSVQDMRAKRVDPSPLPFDWFILALSMLYAMGAIDIDGENLRRIVVS